MILTNSPELVRQAFGSIYIECLSHSGQTNSVDPDETPQNAASHQGLHCLPFIHQFLLTSQVLLVQQVW